MSESSQGLTWDELIGVETGDFDDPVAAPSYRGKEDDLEQVSIFASPDDEDDEESSEWTRADGFSDRTRALRIWANEEGRLEKVLLTRYWRDRAAETTLTAMFDDVLSLVWAYCPPPTPPLPEPISSGTRPELTDEWLSQINEHMASLKEELDNLDPVAAELTWEGIEATGTSEGGRVKVTLDIYGRTASVSIDERWSTTASVSAIARAVMIAEHEAESRHIPPTYVPGKRDEVLARFRGAHEDIIKAMRAGLPNYAS